MKTTIVETGLVVLAKHFNPSVFNQLWLTKNKISTEEEVVGAECIYTSMLAQVSATDYVLLVTPDQLSLSPRCNPSKSSSIVHEKIITIIDTIPHTPFKAMGMNFQFHVEPENISLHELCKKLFYVSSSPLHNSFSDPDSYMGGYLSKNVFGGRLKLDIKSAKLAFPDKKEKVLLAFAFNYHYDIVEDSDPSVTIKSAVNNWDAALNYAESIVKSLDGCDI